MSGLDGAVIKLVRAANECKQIKVDVGSSRDELFNQAMKSDSQQVSEKYRFFCCKFLQEPFCYCNKLEESFRRVYQPVFLCALIELSEALLLFFALLKRIFECS